MEKEIKLKDFLFVMGILIVAELIILLLIIPSINHASMRKHCKLAVCNEDSSWCYNYDLDGDDTKVTWRGDCRGY